ncbi:transglutaminase TgpA family protein [Halococcus agarilyticus]|uniref:transglutaminase TgpA family protein n=1 Tax=Halococcus agarilyticus TaxID=1232219 RepID=UPI000677D78F|nr:transglutaminaseTgpA domain-containing protein [Halococcus agarilyticus]
MSTTARSVLTDRSSWLAGGARRGLALAAAALLIAPFLFVCFEVTDVAGGSDRLLLFVAASFVAATLLARFLPAVAALVIAAALLAVGLWSYVLAVPNGELLLRSLGAVRADVLALLTGLSILQITEAGIWVAGIAPAPTFLTWYFALRRRYVAAAVVGGATLGFFVLTGDAGVIVVLAGVVGVAGVVGFGELDSYDGRSGHAEVLVVVLAAMIVIAPLVSVVPSGASESLVPSGGGGGGGASTVEGSLLAAGDRVGIQGSISLSPELRFTVESDRGSYWRAAAYDRYTGDGWVRTGDSQRLDGSLAGPPGNATTIEQTFEAETNLNLLLTAWKPVDVEGPAAEGATVTSLDGLQPDDELAPGDTYSVTSRQPAATPDELRTAGREYPDGLVERYTGLPGSTPDRVERRTARITANADNPYDTARTVERWLEGAKNYSLDVDRPDGNIADAFLFEMDRGYCVYFATTMVTMLRSQDIPARFVTGYTDGQRVAEDEWVVRGYDSHAWVEVYFPETGWVEFDPTPGGPRTAVEESSLEDARAGNATNVDTNASEGGEWTPTPTATPIGGGENDSADVAPDGQRGLQGIVTDEAADTNGTLTRPPIAQGPAPGASGTVTDDGSSGPELPSPTREQWAFGLVALAGLAAGARRSGVAERTYRELWLRHRPDDAPAAEIEHAFERLEYLLERRHRPRRPGETPRKYLAAVGADDRATRVGELFERARYAGSATQAEADEAAELVGDLVRERTPLVRRLRRS